MTRLKLAAYFYIQEFGSPHQRLLRWTQGILLVFIVTLSLASNSIQSYLNENLQGLLGADAVLSQSNPFTSDERIKVTSLVKTLVDTQHVKTTLTYKDKWQPAKLKAVGESYPLQGQLVASSSLKAKGKPMLSGPEQGHIWLDPRLLASLSINIGETLNLGDRTFIVSHVLQHEPDRLMEGHNVDMRAMIHLQDMAMLGLAPDLIQHRYLIEVTESEIDALIQWQQTNLPAAQIHHKRGNHPLALFWKRTENFMGLASIILFFMAAIAMDQLTKVHMKKDQYFSAVCMSLGVSKSTGVQVSVLKWMLGLIVLLPAVLLLSALSHWLIIYWLSETFTELTWQWNFQVALSSALGVMALFAVFHLPVWLSLINTSVAKLFRNQTTKLSHWVSKITSLAVLSGITIAYSDNALLTTMMVSAAMITILLMIAISWLALTLGEKFSQKLSGLVPFTLFMMKQRLVSKSTQILGVGLSAFMLLFTLMLLKDLGATMTSYERQHNGNVLVSQATQPQMEYIQSWADEKNINVRQSKPYMYAKLIEINQQSLAQYSDKPSDSLATFRSSIRLHWTESVPKNNRVVDGNWWQSGEENWQQISVEEEVMTDLGLEIGDELTFYIHQKAVQFEIVASHVYQAGGGSITFWVQMPQSAVAHIEAPHYNMASIELADEQWPELAALWQKFPTLRMVSLKEMTERFDSILAMITKVISGFSTMIILLAAVVILGAINALESQEKKKNSVIMSFGFTRITCLKLNMIEWFVTATITAIGAILGTYIAGLLIYQSQFNLTYKPDFVWLVATLLIILIFVAGLGIYASRNSLKSSVRELMSET